VEQAAILTSIVQWDTLDLSQWYSIFLCVSVFALYKRKNRNTDKTESTLLPQAKKHLNTTPGVPGNCQLTVARPFGILVL
jgi:hypothetical protein